MFSFTYNTLLKYCNQQTQLKISQELSPNGIDDRRNLDTIVGA